MEIKPQAAVLPKDQFLGEVWVNERVSGFNVC
jgi:hypothetical protein